MSLASSGKSDPQVIVSQGYDDKGFTTFYTFAAGATALPKSYDSRGFLVTPAPTQAIPSPSAQANVLENNAVESARSPAPSASAAFRSFVVSSGALLAAFFGAIFLL